MFNNNFVIISFELYSQWANVFPPCEQFLRRLWTMTGIQLKGGGGGGAGPIGSGNFGEGEWRIVTCYGSMN